MLKVKMVFVAYFALFASGCSIIDSNLWFNSQKESQSINSKAKDTGSKESKDPKKSEPYFGEIEKIKDHRKPSEKIQARYNITKSPDWFKLEPMPKQWEVIEKGSNESLSAAIEAKGFKESIIEKLPRRDFFKLSETAPKAGRVFIETSPDMTVSTIITKEKESWNLISSDQDQSFIKDVGEIRTKTNSLKLTPKTNHQFLTIWDRKAINKILQKIRPAMNRNTKRLIANGILRSKYKYYRFDGISTGPVKIKSLKGNLDEFQFNFNRLFKEK